MPEPRTQYAKTSDGLNIAYQMVGDGPLDLVWVPGLVSHLEVAWEEPLYRRFVEGLASFSRVILFDKRGNGMSDRVSVDELPTLEQRMDDIRAVMDSVGSSQAVIFGISEGAALSVLFAATYPGRTRAKTGDRGTFLSGLRRTWSRISSSASGGLALRGCLRVLAPSRPSFE